MSDDVTSKYWPELLKKPQMLREINHDGMWQHSCTTTMETFFIGKNETCSYCGAWEEDGDDPPASPNWR